MRLFWLGAFIAFEGYVALHALLLGKGDFARFWIMVDVFQQILHADDPTAVPFPDGVPDPGSLPSPVETEKRAPAELARFCVGWALLHELKHIQHQQNGTSAPIDAAPDVVRAEEFSCDEYATRFMLEQMGDYAQQNSVPEDQGAFKARDRHLFRTFHDDAYCKRPLGRKPHAPGHPGAHRRNQSAHGAKRLHASGRDCLRCVRSSVVDVAQRARTF
jgi:hypothetical protein